MFVEGDVSQDFDVDEIIIGTTPLQLIQGDVRANRGIQLIADPNNTGTIYIGRTDITATGRKRFPMIPGSSIMLPIEKVGKVWAVSDTAAQKLFALIV